MLLEANVSCLQIYQWFSRAILIILELAICSPNLEEPPGVRSLLRSGILSISKGYEKHSREMQIILLQFNISHNYFQGYCLPFKKILVHQYYITRNQFPSVSDSPAHLDHSALKTNHLVVEALQRKHCLQKVANKFAIQQS